MGFDKTEIERRRQISIREMDRRNREAWQRRYQQDCDAEYWRIGLCCAGCDHWASDGGGIGQCTAAAPVSGEQVIRSLGISFSSYTPPPGHPYTRSTHVCGQFRDNFDWSTLDQMYLRKIGAVRHGRLREKPAQRGEGE